MPQRTDLAGSASPPSVTIVVMGVMGTGKTSVMKALAGRLGWATADGDDLHPPENVAKMRSGEPLTDADRRPWLEAIASWIGERETASEPAIVACSALRRTYRDLLRRGHPSVWFAHLVVPPAVIVSRVERRQGHYMPPALLASQFETLETLEPDEPGIAIPADGPLGEIVNEIVRHVPRSM